MTVALDESVTAGYVAAEMPKHGVQRAPRDDFGENELTLAVVAVVIGSAVGLAPLILGIVKKVQGGVALDLTGDAPVVRHDRAVPLGWMLVIAKDGRKTRTPAPPGAPSPAATP